jgi:hypothetical protein
LCIQQCFVHCGFLLCFLTAAMAGLDTCFI